MRFTRIVLHGFVVLALLCQTASAEKSRPLTRSPYDPDARQVDLFAGMKEGLISAQVTPRGAEGGNLFLTNQTEEPLTVAMPAGFVGVPVHAQFGPFGPFGNSPGGSGLNGQNQGFTSGNNSSAGASGTQRFGGGTGNGTAGTANSGAQNGLMNGFFSIPVGKTLRLPYTSVCLNHGLNEPTSRTTVQLVPVDEFTSDPVLQALIEKVGSGTENQKTIQAAVWHVANGLSWQELALKGNGPIPVPGNRYFSSAQMEAARHLVTELRETFPASEQVAASATTPPRSLPFSRSLRSRQ